MEEILASIRRIISEDDAPAVTATDPEPETVVEDAVEEEAPAVEEPEPAEEDVLELTEAYEAPVAETLGDLDILTAEPFPSASVPESDFVDPIEVHDPEPEPGPSDEGLVGVSAAASAASAFAGLASSVRKPDPIDSWSGSGPTVDELARALLRPMLKEWLDANLPGIVEAQVRKEVERIARNAG
ncbi:MAG: hypothetical protein RJA14_1892 [Pseudomonadota bacterium]